MFDPSSATHTNDVTIWCDWFATKANLVTNQAIIIAFGGDPSLSHQPFAAVYVNVSSWVALVLRRGGISAFSSP